MASEPNYQVPECECPACAPDLLSARDFYTIVGCCVVAVVAFAGFFAWIGWAARGLFG